MHNATLAWSIGNAVDFAQPHHMCTLRADRVVLCRMSETLAHIIIITHVTAFSSNIPCLSVETTDSTWQGHLPCYLWISVAATQVPDWKPHCWPLGPHAQGRQSIAGCNNKLKPGWQHASHVGCTQPKGWLACASTFHLVTDSRTPVRSALPSVCRPLQHPESRITCPNIT